MAKLLLNECKDVEGTWYAPQKWLSEQRDVVRAELWDTTSSAGDWSGYFVQKYNGNYWLIRFWQENLVDTPCFRLRTGGKPTARFMLKGEPTKEECDEVLAQLEKEMMETITHPFRLKKFEIDDALDEE